MKVIAIGINDYFDLESLYSCVNDALDIKSFFHDTIGLSKDRIISLTTFQQTKKSTILFNIKSFLKSLDSGETGYLFYSGHGGVFRSNKVEENEFFEGVYTSDDAIYEYELRQLLEENLSDDAKLVSVIDTCHSGGIKIVHLLTREKNSLLTRGKSSLEVRTPYPDSYYTPNQIDKIPKNKLLDPLKKNRITFAACEVNELAYGDFFNNKMNGVFTYYFLKILKENRDTTFDYMHQFLTNILPDDAKKYYQTPLLSIDDEFKNQRIIN